MDPCLQIQQILNLLVCHLDDVKQHAGRQALGQAGAVVRQVGCQGLEDEEMIGSELDHA